MDFIQTIQKLGANPKRELIMAWRNPFTFGADTDYECQCTCGDGHQFDCKCPCHKNCECYFCTEGKDYEPLTGKDKKEDLNPRKNLHEAVVGLGLLAFSFMVGMLAGMFLMAITVVR